MTEAAIHATPIPPHVLQNLPDDTPAEQRASAELLAGLVAIPSLSHAEREAAEWLVGQMVRRGYARAYVDAAGNAVGEMGDPGAAHTILLLGHIDTVPGDIPVRVEMTGAGPALYGRGSVDAKGPLAAFVWASGQVGDSWCRDHNVRLVVVGAVEEEAATSRGARFIRDRFDGVLEPLPKACIIGEPSGWTRVTLGYKGRLLIGAEARQPMAHTAGPDAGVATVPVAVWNYVATHCAEFNAQYPKAFDHILPSLRDFHTWTDEAMHDVARSQMGLRLPEGFAPGEFVAQLVAWCRESWNLQPAEESAALPDPADFTGPGNVAIELGNGTLGLTLHLRGYEPAWRSDRQNPLVRSFLGAIRTVGEDMNTGVKPGFVVKTGTSDMNVVAPIWQCPILAYGPGDSALDHTPNEHILLEEYWQSTQVLAVALRNLAGSFA